ncbi:hypothetical protein GWK47_040223 [Chionoecetes opilio]|uniref:Uncharacterized protein n=1 Tax=Chionoecetes opilio TaxID=41210 RepID=A0A8J4YDI7_CHIOP|nr:hypothetical protein GWK47_040223 [Chionoecetes opilio]
MAGDPATRPPVNPDPQEAGNLQPGTRVESSPMSSKPAVLSGSPSLHRAPGSQRSSPAVARAAAVPPLPWSKSTVPNHLCPADYMVALSTSDSRVPSEFCSGELVSPGEKSFVERSITGPPTVATPGQYQESILPGDTWRGRMESLMSRTLNTRLPRQQGPCPQSMHSVPHNPARSMSFGGCVRGRCEGLDCTAAPPMSPMPPYKPQGHQDSSMISLKDLSSPRPTVRCHLRSRSDLPAPHTFSEHYNNQKINLSSVNFCTTHNPVRWSPSPYYSSTRLPVAGGAARMDRSSPSPVRCPTPSLVPVSCAQHLPNAGTADAAHSECVASCVQWIHDQVPPWPTMKTPQTRTFSTVQQEAVFKGEALPTITPERRAAESTVQSYTDCIEYIDTRCKVRGHNEENMITKDNYSPTPDMRVNCCQGPGRTGTIPLHSVSSRVNANSPKCNINFAKGMTSSVSHQSAPQVPKAATIRIPDVMDSTPHECSITF